MSIDDATGARLRASGADLLDVVPKCVGPRLSTPRGGVVHSVRPPGSMTFQSPGDFVAVVLSPVPGIRSRLGSDRIHAFDAPVGAFILNPANVDSATTWSTLRQNVAVGFEPGRLAALALQEFGQADLELRPPRFGHVDTQALQLANLIKHELAEAAGNELYIDSLMTVLGLHVVRHYSNACQRRTGNETKGGLSQLSARRVREFLNENFTGPLPPWLRFATFLRAILSARSPRPLGSLRTGISSICA